MHLTHSQVNDLSGPAFRQFLELRISEGHQIDYKVGLHTKWEKLAREFLKDVTAFANANGGIIVIGAREPSDSLPIDDQIVGIQNACDVAVRLEGLTRSAIDPRISGLLLKPICLEDGRQVLVVRIPQSFSKPHMAIYQKERSFYIRHTESSVPMSTHEIRESVLSSATAEGKAKEYFRETERDFLKYGLGRFPATPVFHFQAVPLTPVETDWPVTDMEFQSIFRDGGIGWDGRKYLDSPIAPTLTLYGIEGKDDRNDPNYITSVHRNGYISTALRIPQYNGERIIFPAHMNYVKAFFGLCSSLTEATGADTSYVLRTRCHYTHGLQFLMGRTYSQPQIRDEIFLPDQLRLAGDDFQDLAEKIISLIYNAFGLVYRK